MNWRRGLFRPWCALTVVWLIVVGVVAMDDWQARPRPRAYDVVAPDGQKFRVESVVEATGEEIAEFVRQSAAAHPRAECSTTSPPAALPPLPPGATLDPAPAPLQPALPPLPPGYQLDAPAAMPSPWCAYPVTLQMPPNGRGFDIWQHVWLGVAVPAAVFAIGSALLWVAAGFGRPRPNQ
jgi:hypothetical protein